MKKKLASQHDLHLLSKYGLGDEDITDAAILEFEQGEFFLREGQPIEYIYFVVSGKAKVCLHASNGKQLLLCYVISDGIFGDIELMTDHKEAYSTVQAVTDFVCIGLPLVSNAKLLRNNISFINHIGQELAHKLRKSNFNSTITILHPLEERLCAYILQTSVNGVFSETLTEVAGLLGSSYRHLLRCLEKLCQDNVLKKQKNGFIIIDENLLTDLANDLYIL